jgi:class 3 adenylate cyclase
VTDMDDNPSVSMKRRLAAILAADIAGYSRLMGEDEAASVRDLKGHQAAVLPLVGRYGGRIIDTAGDGILAEFPSVINAKNPPSKQESLQWLLAFRGSLGRAMSTAAAVEAAEAVTPTAPRPTATAGALRRRRARTDRWDTRPLAGPR